MIDQEIATLRQAIRSQSRVEFVGKDDVRLACPHILGRKNGVWHVFVWQINDAGEHGFKPDEQRWRCFDLHDVRSVRIVPGVWERGWSKGKRGQPCVDEVDTAVAASHAAEVRSI